MTFQLQQEHFELQLYRQRYSVDCHVNNTEIGQIKEKKFAQVLRNRNGNKEIFGCSTKSIDSHQYERTFLKQLNAARNGTRSKNPIVEKL